MENYDWYYNASGGDDSEGPVDLDEMKRLYKAKQIDAETMVWCEDFEDWKELSECPGLLKLLKPKKKGPPKMKKKKKKAPPVKRSTTKTTTKRSTTKTTTKRSTTKTTTTSGGSSDARQEERARRAAELESKASHSWEERTTLEGMSYYYNTKTEALTWDKPDALKSRDSLKEKSADWCWVQDEREGWVPKRGKGEWMFAKSELKRLEQDIVMLDHINEAQIVHNIRERYKQDKIYTWCGASKTVLISVNPFKRLPLYTPNVIDEHRRPPPNKQLEPHVYDIANHALISMRLHEKNQSILISGESGAGKTECAKQCFSFLAQIAGSDSNVEQLILDANPLLEAFGNAKTLRNNNSSRFGKWVSIDFDSVGKIVSAKAESFLLEKIRVVNPAKGERNFHIFYQLFSSTRHRDKYKLDDPSKFPYLSKSQSYIVDGIDDTQDFEEMQDAARRLGFSKAQQTFMFDTIAGILHLGSITFKAKRVGSADGCEVKRSKPLKLAAQFLHLTEEQLRKCVTNRSIVVGGRKTYIPLNPEQAVDACDALAKSIYSRMFDWIVARVNDATKAKAGLKKRNQKYIGVLDIFGFEIFENNSFEQLCINYANEKLQQFFNKHTFKEEESVYISENVPYTKINFIDNQPVLNLIERKRKGILPLLDDEVRMPKGSDEGFMKRVDKENSTRKAYKKSNDLRNRYKKNTYFKVQHYAGDVVYTSDGWLEKNKDTAFDELSVVMSKSASATMQQIYPKKKGRSYKSDTVSERFRKNLRNLMKMLDTTSPCYIRCIKPNHQKRGNMFQAPMCIEQMRNAGVFEAVEIRKSGYPFRLTHKQFSSRYRCTLLKKDLSLPRLRSRPPMYREMCEELLDQMPGNVSGVHIGKTMCLYRAPPHRLMELMRHLKLEQVVPTCQRVMRGHLAREFKRRMLKTQKQLVRAIQKRKLDLLEDAIREATSKLGPFNTLFDFQPKALSEAIQLKTELKNKELADLAKIDLKQAVEEEDPMKRIRAEVYLFSLQVESHAKLFQLMRYPRLKDSIEYANSTWKFWQRKDLEMGMLCHTVDPIHTSLTRLDSHESKQAKLAFRNILCYCGDSGSQAGDPSCAIELINIGLNGGEFVCTEIYVQMLKQLRRSPSPTHERRLWALMGIALTYLKPSIDFEGFLLNFLKGKQSYISTFHETKYDDDSVRPQLTSRKVDEIADEIGSRTERSRYSGVYKVGEGGSVRAVTGGSKTKKKKNTKKSKNSTSSGYRRKTPLYAAQKRMESKEEKSEEEEEEEEEVAPKVVPRIPKPSSRKETRIAAYDFEPQDDTCIEMMEGDKLEILAPEDGGWIEVKNLRTGDSGYVPENYLE